MKIELTASAAAAAFIFVFMTGPVCPAQAEAPAKAAKLAEAGPPAQTPSGTTPAEPAAPAETPAKPADPGKAPKPEAPSKPSGPPEQTPSGTKPAEPAVPGEEQAKPAEPAAKEKPEEPGRKKDKKEKPARKGGKKGKLPGVSAPSGGAAGQGAAAAGGAAALGGLLGGGEKEKEEKAPEKKASPQPAAVETSSAPESPAYSEGTGRKVAVLDFEGEEGAEFASLVAAALAPELRVYDRARLAALGYDPASVNRISARTVAADTGAEYLVTGKVSKKTATLTIISVYLRDGATGDIKQTESRSVRPPDTLQSAASDAAAKIKDAIDAL